MCVYGNGKFGKKSFINILRIMRGNFSGQFYDDNRGT